jgi:hypothetical protein
MLAAQFALHQFAEGRLVTLVAAEGKNTQALPPEVIPAT